MTSSALLKSWRQTDWPATKNRQIFDFSKTADTKLTWLLLHWTKLDSSRTESKVTEHIFKKMIRTAKLTNLFELSQISQLFQYITFKNCSIVIIIWYLTPFYRLFQCACAIRRARVNGLTARTRHPWNLHRVYIRKAFRNSSLLNKLCPFFLTRPRI